MGAAAAFLAGCSTGAVPPQSLPQQQDSHTALIAPAVALPVRNPVRLSLPALSSRTLIYVSEPRQNVIDVYDTSLNLVGQIRQGVVNPGGLAVDGNENLYVANIRGGNVTVYARGSTSPFLTLDGSGIGPSGVAVRDDGTVYVAGQGRLNGAVNVYAPGAVQPEYQLTHNASSMKSVALDSNRYVYVTGYNAISGPYVVRFDPDSSGPGLNLQLNNASDCCIALDGANDIVLDGGSIKVYRQHHKNRLKTFGGNTNGGLAFNGDWSALYVSAGDAIDVYRYADGQRIAEKVKTGAFFYGVAVSPAPPW
jgi:sugar lactone lactonase YvrE